jgi:signal transduction histidine kinase/CheY-like chemotaxis protein
VSTPEFLAAAAQAHAPCGLLSFDDTGIVVHANAQLHRLLQRAEGEIVGRPVDRIMSAPGRVFYSTHLFPLLKLQGRVDELQLSLCAADGQELPVMLSAARAAADDGRIVNHCALMTVPHRHEFEHALIEARRQAESATTAKDEFLAMVSHELRTPLGAILGWARLAQSGKLTGELMARALQTIERNAKMQAQLIEDLLDVSRIVSGKLRLSPRPVDLSSAVDGAIDTARPAALTKGIELVAVLDRAAGVVLADPDRVQQIVWNLVSNAIKFTPKGGRVQVTLARAGSRVRIAVSDTGAGLAPAQLPRVFDRFWQQDPSSRRESTGLGLGLAICKNLVEMHGATIAASSAGPGQGATFTVEFPLALAAASAANGTAGAAGALPADQGIAGLCVLVVDDDADAREMMRMLLQAEGAEVLAAASCDEALQRLAQRTPDLLISDIGMPGRDGFELIRQVRAGVVPPAQHVPGIAITGLARPQDRVNLLRAGYQSHLSKPVEPQEVLALVAALAQRRG